MKWPDMPSKQWQLAALIKIPFDDHALRKCYYLGPVVELYWQQMNYINWDHDLTFFKINLTFIKINLFMTFIYRVGK